MGNEVRECSEMAVVKCKDSLSRSSNATMLSSRHRHGRSKSAPQSISNVGIPDFSPEAQNHPGLDAELLDESINVKRKQSPTTVLQSSLKQEILQLEKRLQDQFVVRKALEKALGFSSASHMNPRNHSMPKVVAFPTEELIKEISVLEVEVGYLEQYLLSLYRKAFGQHAQSSSLVTTDKTIDPSSISQEREFMQVSELKFAPKKASLAVSSRSFLSENCFINSGNKLETIRMTEKQIDSSVHRCHSSLSQRSTGSKRWISSPIESFVKSIRPCHSQPLSSMEHAQYSDSSLISLAEHLGTSISDHVPESPDRISEDVIRNMASIYSKIAEPSQLNLGFSSSPTSSPSTRSTFSPPDQSDMWSPSCTKEAPCDVRLTNPFHIEGLKDDHGQCNTLVEVSSISVERLRSSEVKRMLHNYMLLVQRLEKVDLSKMKHVERLAFWINIHNALVMHAYLAYGVSQNTFKRTSQILKVAYNIGGHNISADIIQSSILGCHMHRPSQWLWSLLSPRTKFKSRADRQAYCIQEPEPLVYFAFSTGCFSDPAVRIYTAKRVYQELEIAKQDYILASVSIRREQKIVLPKIFENFAKDSYLNASGVVGMIKQYLPETRKKAIQRCLNGRSRKINIEFLPHNYAFRFLISRELAK
ncbi:uncharacterized protein LOC18445971 isoform X2 [Amborella trichopoda]|uniref:uncharacterized protein LOC18445971 isoform X2 n=1 Tax=Amborella trichopoda TaxID=13333 RepID=UPI0009BFB57B|nr:uncharacterized protein LOC18445971 isoform X2 [Amborella trichopoda]|eukprot:XP_020530310.1 uncharacterized protein LOC18445971 isoform X2 [Amborella trichopoda]